MKKFCTMCFVAYGHWFSEGYHRDMCDGLYHKIISCALLYSVLMVVVVIV